MANLRHVANDGHRRLEERSILLHRAVAEKLRNNADVLAMARERVESWCADGSVHPHYAEAWQRLLAQSLDTIVEQIVDPGETMRAMRQCTPFAGALDPRERWAILRRAREHSAP